MGRWSILIRARKKKEALSYVHDYISRGQSMHHAGDHCSGTLLFSITLPLYWDIKTMEVQNTERLFSAMRMEDGVMKDCGIAEIFKVKGYQWKKMGRRNNRLGSETSTLPSSHPSIELPVFQISNFTTAWVYQKMISGRREEINWNIFRV